MSCQGIFSLNTSINYNLEKAPFGGKRTTSQLKATTLPQQPSQSLSQQLEKPSPNKEEVDIPSSSADTTLTTTTNTSSAKQDDDAKAAAIKVIHSDDFVPVLQVYSGSVSCMI